MNEQNKRVSAFCSDALGTLDGVGIAERISSGEISAAEAVDAAIARAKSTAQKNLPSQVIVHKADGEIQTEFTYGDDPKKKKG